MNSRKGLGNLEVNTLIRLLGSLMVAGLVFIFIFSGIVEARTASECGGIIRKSAAWMANTAGLNIC